MVWPSPKPDPDPDPDPRFSSGFGGCQHVSHRLTNSVGPKDSRTSTPNGPLDKQLMGNINLPGAASGAVCWPEFGTFDSLRHCWL